MPPETERLAEIDQGRFGDEEVASASVHEEAEQLRYGQFESYVKLLLEYAPAGKWLDVGCGTGHLITLAQRDEIECEGIELTRERREVAKRRTSVVIHDRPLEHLDLPVGTFAAVAMINVFSHLISPTQTLDRIHQVLQRDGILLIHTGEVGAGARAHHSYAWSLGDHLHWLGEHTIDRYAEKCGFLIISHTKQWNPDIAFSRECMAIKGRSATRNLVKTAVLRIPGAFSLFRWFMLGKRHRRNPTYSATVVMKRVDIAAV